MLTAKWIASSGGGLLMRGFRGHFLTTLNHEALFDVARRGYEFVLIGVLALPRIEFHTM